MSDDESRSGSSSDEEEVSEIQKEAENILSEKNAVDVNRIVEAKQLILSKINARQRDAKANKKLRHRPARSLVIPVSRSTSNSLRRSAKGRLLRQLKSSGRRQGKSVPVF